MSTHSTRQFILPQIAPNYNDNNNNNCSCCCVPSPMYTFPQCSNKLQYDHSSSIVTTNVSEISELRRRLLTTSALHHHHQFEHHHFCHSVCHTAPPTWLPPPPPPPGTMLPRPPVHVYHNPHPTRNYSHQVAHWPQYLCQCFPPSPFQPSQPLLPSPMVPIVSPSPFTRRDDLCTGPMLRQGLVPIQQHLNPAALCTCTCNSSSKTLSHCNTPDVSSIPTSPMIPSPLNELQIVEEPEPHQLKNQCEVDCVDDMTHDKPEMLENQVHDDEAMNIEDEFDEKLEEIISSDTTSDKLPSTVAGGCQPVSVNDDEIMEPVEGDNIEANEYLSVTISDIMTLDYDAVLSIDVLSSSDSLDNNDCLKEKDEGHSDNQLPFSNFDKCVPERIPPLKFVPLSTSTKGYEFDPTVLTTQTEHVSSVESIDAALKSCNHSSCTEDKQFNLPVSIPLSLIRARPRHDDEENEEPLIVSLPIEVWEKHEDDKKTPTLTNGCLEDSDTEDEKALNTLEKIFEQSTLLSRNDISFIKRFLKGEHIDSVKTVSRYALCQVKDTCGNKCYACLELDLINSQWRGIMVNIEGTEPLHFSNEFSLSC